MDNMGQTWDTSEKAMRKYQKEQLLKKILCFHKDNGRFPTTRDIKSGALGISRKPFLTAFGSMQEAFTRAEQYAKGEIEFDEHALPTGKQWGFQCSFCGAWCANAPDYYSSLVNILTNRFINLLNRNAGSIEYKDIGFDFIHAVFGANNTKMRGLLGLHGYLEAFDEKFLDEDGMGKMVLGKQE